MRIIAHRGAWCSGDSRHDVIYQNTIWSFYNAERFKADAVETDIRKCGCGRLLLSHDAFEGCACKRKPWLSEILRFGERMDLYLEIKEKNLASEVLESTLRSRHEAGFVYTSFIWSELWKVRKMHNKARIGLLWGEDSRIPRFLVTSAAYFVGAESIQISFELLRKDPGLVKYFKSKGFIVCSYTVNEIDDMHFAKKTGLDAIFTDFPERAKKFLQKQ